VDTVIYASSSDSLFFFVNKRKMDLFGNADLRYKDTELKSANISVDFLTHNVDASGAPSDTLPGKLKNTPVLSQGGEVYDGIKMIYNYKTQRGIVSEAKTKSEGQLYSGLWINKVDKETYFVKDGIFTTCDSIPPHYYFYSPEMKVINKKEIIAKWIWLYIEGVPLPVPLPFAVFPIESGRRSGLIAPAFGDDATYGFYFTHIGYFWAINDFIDWNITADYYTRGSFGLQSRFRYAKRYDYSGNIQMGYKLLKAQSLGSIGQNVSKNWQLIWQHNQSFTPSLQLSANIQFVSGKNYIESTTYNLNEALTNNIFSNATLSKSWDDGNSMSISYSRQQDLIHGNVSEILPNFTFNIPEKYPFRRSGIVNDQKWFELIGINYNGQFQNDRNLIGGQLSVRGGIEHNIGISASPKIGYFNISPSIQYTEKWYDKRIVEQYAGQKIDGSDSILINDENQINMVRTFSLGLSASTRFYGMFTPDVLGISAIRHTVIPTLSYNFQPDYSKPMWGYYGTYLNSKGQKVSYDKFQREIFGGAGSGEQQNLSFSLGNIFEMKTEPDPTDTTSKVNKIQLLNLTAGISYNFAADSLKFSDLNLNYRTQIGNYLNFSGSSNFSLYDHNPEGVKINKFLINEGKGFVNLTNFNFSISTNLSADNFKSSNKKEDTTKHAEQSQAYQQNNDIYQGIYNTKKPDFSLPWSLSLSYNYSFTKYIPLSVTSNLSANLDFNLTNKWKFTVTGSYDLQQKEFSAPQIRISRDLHDWLMNFTWNPVGTFRGYFFEISFKASQLQDLKLTKSGQFYSGK
jgi:lipopolysaccharide assembly outer membrane protein LptD (OstA)